MILKKPYAFLIKYFKLIHVFLVVPLCYLLYRTNVVLNFLQEYISSEQIIVGRDFTSELFNTWMFALPFIIILVLGILLGVMFYKKKPKIFYIYNILVMIGLLVVYNIGYNIIETLEAQLIETRTLRLIRDIFSITILFQGIGVVFTFVRATGFDIKKFDFSRDLEKLDIAEADAEEFEVDVTVETNVFKRDFRKNIRFAKYIYVENKFIINGVFLIILAISCFFVYMNLTIYNKTYKQAQTFSATDFAMSINNSYLTNRSYNGVKITDNYLLVVELNIKSYSENTKLNTTKMELRINGNIYYPNNKYATYLEDLGPIYNYEKIDVNKFQTFLLIYEIPKDLVNEKMSLKYLDGFRQEHNKFNPKYIKIKLNPQNLDNEEDVKKVSVNDSVKLNESIFDTTTFNITSFEFQEKFKINYKFCIKSECYDSFEYLTPILNSNYDKVLLKIDGTATIDENLENKEIKNLYSIINSFGKIKYKSGTKIKYYNNLTRIIPKRVQLSNSYYIEVPKEVIDSDEISFIIDARDKVHEYIIK